MSKALWLHGEGFVCAGVGDAWNAHPMSLCSADVHRPGVCAASRPDAGVRRVVGFASGGVRQRDGSASADVWQGGGLVCADAWRL